MGLRLELKRFIFSPWDPTGYLHPLAMILQQIMLTLQSLQYTWVRPSRNKISNESPFGIFLWFLLFFFLLFFRTNFVAFAQTFPLHEAEFFSVVENEIHRVLCRKSEYGWMSGDWEVGQELEDRSEREQGRRYREEIGIKKKI